MWMPSVCVSRPAATQDHEGRAVDRRGARRGRGSAILRATQGTLLVCLLDITADMHKHLGHCHPHCYSPEHIPHRAYTTQSIHHTEHTPHRAHTTQSLYHTEHISHRAYTTQSIHHTEHTPHRAYITQSIYHKEHTPQGS